MALGQDVKNSDHKADKNLKSSSRINPTTLAMEFSLPLGSYPGRAGNSLPVGINYTSKVWRTQPGIVWWTTTPSGYPIFHTDTNPVFAQRSAAGWTSTLSPPHIIEKLEIFDENGDRVSRLLTLAQLNELNSNEQSNLLEYCTRTCRVGIVTGWTYECTPWTCVDISCQPGQACDGGGPRGGWGEPPPPPVNTPPPPPPRHYYVKRIHVQLPDGSTHEFRKDDLVHPYCIGSVNDPSTCTNTNGAETTGTYLSVDVTGLKLEKGATFEGQTRDILYLPDGGRYVFSPIPTDSTNEGSYRPAEKFLDINGNVSKYNPSTKTWTDTLNRTITDVLPSNWIRQNQTVRTDNISLPGLAGVNFGTIDYKFKWEALGNVFDQELPVEDRTLNYIGRQTCVGNLSNLTSPGLFTQSQDNTRICTSTGENNVPVKFNEAVLSSVQLPNGKEYVFKYNRFGEITKIVYPSGSYESFIYNQIIPLSGANSVVYDQMNRGVTERKLYDVNGVLQQRWQYSAGVINSTYKITTTAPLGGNALGNGIKSEKYLYYATSDGADFGFNNPRVGTPYEDITYDEVGDRRSRTLTEWITAPPRTGGNTQGLRDPRVKRTVSVMIENGQALATLSESEYETPGENGSSAPTDAEYFAHLNVRKAKSYEYAVIPLNIAQTGTLAQIAAYFNSSLLSNTAETDYQYDANYKARGIASLPSESRVLDKNGNVLVKSQTVFDETAYLDPSGSGQLSGSLINTWKNPATDTDIPAASQNLRGKPTTAKVWDSDNNAWIQTHTQYDQYGNARKAWEANEGIGSNRFAETEYSADYGFAYPTKVITPAPDPDNIHGTNQGSFATTTYDFMTGLSLTSTNEFDQTTATEYNDALLRPTRSFAVNFAAPETQTIYIDTALTVKVRKQIDQNNWDEATTFMDSLGRTIKTQATDSQGDITVETEYDLLGRVKRTSNPYRAGDVKLWSVPRYDEMGRAVESYAPAPDGETGASLGITQYAISTQSGFVGTSVTATDASGRRSRSITNGLGQLARVDEAASDNSLSPLPQASPTPNPSPSPTPRNPPDCITPRDPPGCAGLTGSDYPMNSTFYKYNVQGKMVEVTQGAQKRFFMYDSLGRLIRVRQPEQDINAALELTDVSTGNKDWTAKFTYDLFGNVLTTTDAKGTIVTNTYDKANRVKTRIYSGEPAGQTTPAVSYFYDGKGLATAPPTANNYAKGNLTKVTSSVSETRYTQFDSLGRLLQSQQITDGRTFTSGYQYDFAGRLVEETYPSGRVVRNSFEADGDLLKVESQKAGTTLMKPYVSNFSYTASGGISQMRLGNGRWETAKFNERLQETELGLGASASDQSIWKVAYGYGELNTDGTVNEAKNTGNIAKQIISFAGLAQPFVQTFKYDSLYRITEAKEVNGTATTANWQQSWSYDRYGNRIGFAQNVNGNQLPINHLTLPEVNPNTNRFTHTDYNYDRNGNLTNDPVNGNRLFVFNGDNKQTEVRNPNITTSPSNPDANLIGRYTYDGEGKRVKKQSNEETTIFVYSGDNLVAEYSTKLVDNPSTNYTTTDHLGSPRVITNELGQIKSRRDFMPFGEDLSENIGNRTTSLKYGNSDGVRQKFTGYQKDAETALDFAEARMYNSAHGRFTAVDPLLASGKSDNPQTFNRYIYVGNNPVNITDPTGEKWAIRNYEENGRHMVSFLWYDQKLTDEQLTQGWADYDYKTNRFYASQNYVWYLARDQKDFVMVTREQMDFVNGEGTFSCLQGRGTGFNDDEKKMAMEAALYALRIDNRDPILRSMKEKGEMVAGGVTARASVAKSTNVPAMRPLPSNSLPPTVRVGQWMSKGEYEEFLNTGIIPRTNVLTKGRGGYMDKASKGDYYVRFNMQKSLLVEKDKNLGWSLIKSKNKMYLVLAEKKGITLPPPVGTNIKHIATKGK